MWDGKMQPPAQLGLQLREKSCRMAPASLTFDAPDNAIVVPERSREASARKPADGPRGKSLVLRGAGIHTLLAL